MTSVLYSPFNFRSGLNPSFSPAVIKRSSTNRGRIAPTAIKDNCRSAAYSYPEGLAGTRGETRDEITAHCSHPDKIQFTRSGITPGTDDASQLAQRAARVDVGVVLMNLLSGVDLCNSVVTSLSLK